MKDEKRCQAKFKNGRRWEQCKHPAGHSGRHVYHTKRGGHRFFTNEQARYWVIPTIEETEVTQSSPRDRMKMESFAQNSVDPSKVTRVHVKYDFTGLNWDFIQLMAEIVPYADAKYTSFAQFALKRLTGQASPLNHVFAHAKQFIMGEPYDHFDHKPERHLAAIAYNASMEYLYIQLFGYVVSPLSVPEAKKRIEAAGLKAYLDHGMVARVTVDRPKKKKRSR